MADVRLQKKVGKGRHLSAMKRHRQSVKRKARNRHILSRMKTSVKEARAAIASGRKDAVSKNLSATISILHKAASKGVIPKKRASRLSSRLAKAANAAR